MGEAKRRGTFEQRKAVGERKRLKEYSVKRELLARRPSPKHQKLMAAMLALTAGTLSK